MKFNSGLLFASALVIAVVSAEADPRRCWRWGQPCSKLKRAVDTATSILDEPLTSSYQSTSCFSNGQPCAKANRAELALRNALQQADPDNYGGQKPDPANHFCEKGQPCPKKVKNVTRSVGGDVEARDDSAADHSFCHSEGQQCHKVKRAADALAEALAEPEPEPEPEADPEARRCWRWGQPCSKAKRALDHLREAADDAFHYITEDLPGSDHSRKQ